MIPFRTQYDKIVGAYLRNELNPFSPCACFVGNLLNNRSDWANARDIKNYAYNPACGSYPNAVRCIALESDGMYTPEQIANLERVFLETIYPGKRFCQMNQGQPLPEDSLFKAMEVTLLKLREIHEANGEVVEDYTFKQRASLVKTN